MNKEEIKNFLESLQNYDGYIQYFDKPIKEEDIFINRTIKVDPDAYIYEAHFSNQKESIAIKCINDSWKVSRFPIENIPDSDKDSFYSSIEGLKVKTAQIWINDTDTFCLGLKKKRLQNVVFAGFEEIKND